MAEPRDTWKMAALARLMVGAVMLWAIWLTYRHRHTDAYGTVILDGTQLVVDGCRKVPVAGENSIGADLRGPDGNVLRVVRNGQGEHLWLYPKGGGAAIPIDRRDCSEWDVTFHWDYPGPLEIVGGTVSVTCVVGGRKLNGLASFDHCPAK